VRNTVILQLLQRFQACHIIRCNYEDFRTDNSWEEALGRVVSLQKEDPCVHDTCCANWWIGISLCISCKQKLLNRKLVLINGVSIVTFIFPFTVIKFMCLFPEVHFAPWSPYCVVYITRYLPVTINTTVYYILLYEFHSCMFWPLAGHLQAMTMSLICDNSKFVISQERLLKVLKFYNFLCVQRWHNTAASSANCVMTLYLLKVHLQTFLSIPITQKC